MKPSGPEVQLSPGQHALNQHIDGRTPYLSAAKRSGGAENISGIPYALDVDKVKENGVEVIDTPEIEADMRRLAEKDSTITQERIEAWKTAQDPIKGPEGGEVLIKGEVQPKAIESVGLRGLKGVSRGLFWLSVGVTVYDLGKATQQSVQAKSSTPIKKEITRQAGAWGIGIAGAKAGAAVGAVGGPVGAVIGGLVGGLVFGVAGYWAGDKLAAIMF